LAPSRSGKNSVENSQNWIAIRVSTRIRLLLVWRHTSQKFTRFRRHILQLSADFAEMPLSRNGKNSCF